MVPNVGRFTCGWHVVCLKAARLAEGEAHIGRASGDEPSRRTGERVTMESTRIRAPFDRRGTTTNEGRSASNVGMGDRQRHADRRLAPVQSGLPPDTYLCASQARRWRREHARGLGHEADGAARLGCLWVGVLFVFFCVRFVFVCWCFCCCWCCAFVLFVDRSAACTLTRMRCV